MKGKTFFAIGLAVVAIISVVTSLIAFTLFQKQLLAAPAPEGQIQVGGGVKRQMVNVVIIDSSTIAGISNLVNFSVERGVENFTQIPVGGLSPAPFLIRNDGNVKANVQVYSTNNQLFTSSSSYLKFWIEQIQDPSVYDSPWNTLDRCTPNDCFASTPCDSYTNACDLPFSSDGSTKVAAIDTLEFANSRDEAVMHIRIFAADDEPAEDKWTKVVLVGSQA